MTSLHITDFLIMAIRLDIKPWHNYQFSTKISTIFNSDVMRCTFVLLCV